MKQARFFLVALLCLMTSVACKADDKMIPVEKLPDAAKTFVEQEFPGKKIIFAQVDRGLRKTYEVRLGDGTEIDFDKKGVWDKVDCKMTAVPTTLVPAVIQDYVKQSFADARIVKIDKERYGYDIELSNDLELKFNTSGQLIGMDD
jgi:hypothetical protein